jgi:regulator of protease activity HflC (stomatin/prohibitin superfamily)
VELVSLGALFRGRSPVDGLLEAAEQRVGFTLRTAWAVRFLRRSLPPLMLAMAALLWLSTAFVVVRPEEEGVRLRFGRLVTRTPVSPGLALKLPWPFERIDRFPTRRVQSLSLGFSGGRRASLLWTQAHTGVEYSMLLGDGRELVAVDAEVTYRIRDVVAYALNHQNPGEALDALAYRLLMRKTVVTALDRLLSVNRDRFSAEFTRDLQQTADAEDLGLEILHTAFVSLHPPVRIAPEYQAVVGAQIERETLVTRAEVEGAAALPRAQAEAESDLRKAEGEAAIGIAEAKGQASRFLAALESYRASPDLFAFRRWLEALEEGLRRAGIDMYVLDHTLEEERPGAGANDFWLDLRPGNRQP